MESEQEVERQEDVAESGLACVVRQKGRKSGGWCRGGGESKEEGEGREEFTSAANQSSATSPTVRVWRHHEPAHSASWSNTAVHRREVFTPHRK